MGINHSATHSREKLLTQLLAKAAARGENAAILPDFKTYPIPYFGNVATASIFTLGVNPSAKEFSSSRSWPKTINAEDLDYRLTTYFNGRFAPHPWFAAWESCLMLLGHSYRTDTVHLDLSPTATKSMRSTNRNLFLKMIVSDLMWFLSALALCPKIEAGLMAGSVTGRFYMDEFIRRYLPSDHSLKTHTSLGGAQRGATAVYTLKTSNRSVPLFFCSTSPSGDRGIRLKQEIMRYRETLATIGFAGSAHNR
jgi:hypothetical protein